MTVANGFDITDSCINKSNLVYEGMVVIELVNRVLARVSWYDQKSSSYGRIPPVQTLGKCRCQKCTASVFLLDQHVNIARKLSSVQI